MIDQLLDDPFLALQKLVLMAPALLIAVTLHEVAHGLVADRLGDPTPRLAGRLTLNPLPHIDVLGAVAFVLAGFGWARPVPVSAANFRHPRRDMALVAAAGPVTNFVVAFFGLLALLLAGGPNAAGFVMTPLAGMLHYAYQFNLGLAIFNLIPLPPLDGGHFLPYLLPRGARQLSRQLYQYGPMILILLVITRVTDYIMVPAFRAISRLYLAVATLLF
jgi:Zn-dependent protease